jgi:hypothetical protein
MFLYYFPSHPVKSGLKHDMYCMYKLLFSAQIDGTVRTCTVCMYFRPDINIPKHLEKHIHFRGDVHEIRIFVAIHVCLSEFLGNE